MELPGHLDADSGRFQDVVQVSSLAKRQEVERRDLRFALERALSEIKIEFRETFVLVEFGDLDYAEAASVLGVELGTVKSRMSRARTALREKLEAWGYKP